MMWPPTWVSTMVSAIGTASRLCSRGLNAPKSHVNTSNARCWGASTSMEARTVVGSVVCVMASLPVLLDVGGGGVGLFDCALVSGEGVVPEGVELGAHLA